MAASRAFATQAWESASEPMEGVHVLGVMHSFEDMVLFQANAKTSMLVHLANQPQSGTFLIPTSSKLRE